MNSIKLFENAEDAKPYSAGQIIFSVGGEGDVMYAVSEGEVDILSIDGKYIETIGPGGIFGEMALIDNERRSANAVAKTDCKLIVIDEKRFTFLVQQTPGFSIQVMKIMADRLRRRS